MSLCRAVKVLPGQWPVRCRLEAGHAEPRHEGELPAPGQVVYYVDGDDEVEGGVLSWPVR